MHELMTEVTWSLHGWWLVVNTHGPAVSRAQLVKIVDTRQIYPTAIYPWLGR